MFFIALERCCTVDDTVVDDTWQDAGRPSENHEFHRCWGGGEKLLPFVAKIDGSSENGRVGKTLLLMPVLVVYLLVLCVQCSPLLGLFEC